MIHVLTLLPSSQVQLELPSHSGFCTVQLEIEFLCLVRAVNAAGFIIDCMFEQCLILQNIARKLECSNKSNLQYSTTAMKLIYVLVVFCNSN